ncbi:MAG: maleylacetate reductase [Solirubrobacteraceae bacterium]
MTVPASPVMTGLDFEHRSEAVTVRFARGALASLADVLDRSGLQAPLVVCSPEQEDLGRHAAGLLGDGCVGVHAEAVVHVPATVAATGVEEARRLGTGALVAVGGGSATGLAKAVALETGIPIVAVPTTFAGSEMTPIWGMTDRGVKRTGRSPRVRPVAVVYDPALVDGLPVPVAVASGINALAHAAESLWAPDRSPITELLAREGIRAMTTALPALTGSSDDDAAWDEALYGAWLCGSCLGSTAMGIHHALCHALGGTLDLPHAQTHAVVLPVVLELQRTRDPDAIAAYAEAAGTAPDGPADALRDLARRGGVPTTLAQLGVRTTDVDRVVPNVHLAPALQRTWTPADTGAALHRALGAPRPATAPEAAHEEQTR